MLPTLQPLGLILLAFVPMSTALIPWKYPVEPYPVEPYPVASECPTCTKPKHCANEGWDWAWYPSNLHNDGDNYPGFRGDVFKTHAPTYSDTTPAIGSAAAYGSTFYNSSKALSSSYFVLNHHAYLWACESGTWQFDISGVDDLVLGWVGDAAYSGWTDENANGRAVWSFTGSTHLGSASFTADLDGGAFVPIRFLFANAQGGGAFRLTITSPSGIIVHQTGRDTNNDWIVRFSCPFSPRAPKFPSFGEES